MTRLIYLIYICILFSSCGAFRKVFKLKESERVEITQDRRTDSVGVTVDRSITTVREKLDTTIATPAKTVEQNVPLNIDSLINGITAIKNELIDVKLHLNPITGILSTVATIKPQQVSVRIDRVTTKQNNITQAAQKQEAVISNTKAEKKHAEVDREPMKVPNWIIVVAILLVAGVSAFFWVTRRR